MPEEKSKHPPTLGSEHHGTHNLHVNHALVEDVEPSETEGMEEVRLTLPKGHGFAPGASHHISHHQVIE
jgi:hypothetical protein